MIQQYCCLIILFLHNFSLVLSYGDLCGQFFWSRCSFSKNNVSSQTSVTPESCQAGCGQSPDCSTFRYSNHSAPYCLLLDHDYRASCLVVAGSTSGSGFFGGGQDYLDCVDASDEGDTCERMREEECQVSGDNSYRAPSVSSPELCADICYQVITTSHVNVRIAAYLMISLSPEPGWDELRVLAVDRRSGAEV